MSDSLTPFEAAHRRAGQLQAMYDGSTHAMDGVVKPDFHTPECTNRFARAERNSELAYDRLLAFLGNNPELESLPEWSRYYEAVNDPLRQQDLAQAAMRDEQMERAQVFAGDNRQERDRQKHDREVLDHATRPVTERLLLSDFYRTELGFSIAPQRTSNPTLDLS